MSYLFDHAAPPVDLARWDRLNTAAASLAGRLSELDVGPLPISDYNKRYFGGYLQSVPQLLQLYTYLLGLAIAQTPKANADVTFVDYGGGSGIYSLLAKECGIGTVIYLDIYEVSCRDAETIAQAVGAPADAYVAGELAELQTHLAATGLPCDAIASHDVIEHIYDLDEFFVDLTTLPYDESMTIVMASSVNAANPRIRRRTMKQHREAEYVERSKEWGHKERDTLHSFLKLRKDIVSNWAKVRGLDLSLSQIDAIASATRGQRREEIEATAQRYLDYPSSLPTPEHPTNTADPLTGNWADRLIEPGSYARILTHAGFDARVLAGYYPTQTSVVKAAIGKSLNASIARLGRRALPFAPFFVVYGSTRS